MLLETKELYMGEFTIQTLKKDDMTRYEKAQMYYSLLSVWNFFSLTEREIQLLAYTAIRGTISSTSAKLEFTQLYRSSTATINNMVSKLKALKLLVKDGGKYKVNPAIDLDFTQNIVLGLKLLGGDNG